MQYQLSLLYICRTTHSKSYNTFGAHLVPLTVLTALTKDTISVSKACCILVVPFSSQLDTECTSLEWEREERRKRGEIRGAMGHRCCMHCHTRTTYVSHSCVTRLITTINVTSDVEYPHSTVDCNYTTFQ